jgi:polyphosphate kinase
MRTAMTRLDDLEAARAPAPCLSLSDITEPGYLNRELSWLAFNERVLTLAEDPRRPPLERAKFLAIVSQNLDEFFQVRVGALKEQLRAGLVASSFDGMSPAEQLEAIQPAVAALVARQSRTYHEELLPALARGGIEIVEWDELDEPDRARVGEIFDREIYPVLTPLAVDPAHPFPYVSGLSLNLAVVVRDVADGDDRFARLKVPPVPSRFVGLGDGVRFIPVEQLVAAHLDRLFPGMSIASCHPFRVTRNADVALEEDGAADLLEALEDVLRRRRRAAAPVRLEIDASMPEHIVDLMRTELELDQSDVHVVPVPLDLSGLWSLFNLERPALKDVAWRAVVPNRLTSAQPSGDVFRVLREGEVLLHHPYDSFQASVEAFIDQAAEDPDVLAIKQTLYRTSGPPSAIVRGLIRAAGAGKQVVALVELKARFDEEANIAWARTLEQAGVHVVYGVVGLKTHAKVALVVRREADGIRGYCHVGTGNYNPNTALMYEDVGLLSAEPLLAADVTDFFNYLTGYSAHDEYDRLVVAPSRLRHRLLDLVDDEAGRLDGEIVMKMNGLSDPEVIGALYAASQSGTNVDLVVRSICCLRPGVPGLSDRIRVRSIIGRYLEHSRIYRFGSATRGRRHFIGSADLMQRNLDGRVEALVEITDPRLTRRLDEILALDLHRDAVAWELSADGTWRPTDPEHPLDVQHELQRLAVARSHPSTFDG